MNTIYILYASETGNSQDLAQLLAARLRRLVVVTGSATSDTTAPIANIIVSSFDDALAGLVDRLNAHLQTPNDYLNDLNLLFPLVSTTGQGEMPRSALRFWRFILRRNLPNTLFSHFLFSSFGLGDSSYPRFNWAVRKLHTRLLQLGALEIGDKVPRAEADEQSSDPSTDKVYQEWEDRIVGYLESLDKFKDPSTGVGLLNIIPDDTILDPVYPLSLKEVEPSSPLTPSSLLPEKLLATSATRIDPPKVFPVSITSMARITAPSYYQDVRHLTLKLPDSIRYNTGDTLALYPSNHPADIQALLDHMGWASQADQLLTVPASYTAKISSLGGKLVEPLTLRNFLLHHLDIIAVPRRSFFSAIWRFSQAPQSTGPTVLGPSGKKDPNSPEHAALEREKLKAFASQVDDDTLEDLYNYANRPRRSILETLLEFGSLGKAPDGTPRVPISHIADIFPVLRPRLFSIASAQTGPSAELCIAMVRYKTILRRTRRGVCSRWLEDCVAPVVAARGSVSVAASLQLNNLFKSAPPQLAAASVPLLLISAGTGVAPIRALVEHYRVQFASKPQDFPELYVFFGCRALAADFHYAAEWQDLLRDPNFGSKVHLYVAFSQPSLAPKNAPALDFGPNYKALEGVHLQAHIYAQRTLISELLRDRSALVYLCGSSGKFPTETRSTFITALTETIEGYDTASEEQRDEFKDTATQFVHNMEQKGRFIQETW